MGFLRVFITGAVLSNFMLWGVVSSSAQVESYPMAYPKDLAASEPQKPNEYLTPVQKKSRRINKNVVRIMTGALSGTYVRFGADLSEVLNTDRLRIIPMLGQGSRQNIDDILFLKGVDVGIVQSDTLNYLQKDKNYEGLSDKIRYISKLYNEEVHILANSSVTSIEGLQGKLVNFGRKESGTYITGRTIFNKLGLKVQVTRFAQNEALEKLRRNKISAMVYVVGKPASVIRSISPTDPIHLLSIPYKKALQDTYLPSTIAYKDYPNLVPLGKRVSTLSIGAVMAVYNWPKDSKRHVLIKRSIESFFENIETFSNSARHPKWKEVSLLANVPGWKRFSAAQELLKGGEKRAVRAAQEEELFIEFLKLRNINRNKMGEPEKRRLFRAFLKWSEEN